MTNAKEISKGIVKAVITLCLIAAGLYLIYQITDIFLYIAFALILSLIGSPIMRFFKKKLRFNKIASVLSTMFIFLLAISGFIFMFIPLFTTQAENLAVLNTHQLQDSFNNLLLQLDTFLDSKGFSLDKILDASEISSKFNISFLPNLLNTIIGTLSGLGIGIASIFFITFFFLKDQAVLKYQFKKLLPKPHSNQILNSIQKINNLLSRYFVGLILQMTIIFILSLIVFLSFGVKGALMIAFLCAILNIIPYIGPLIGNILGVLFTMMSFISEDFTTVVIPKAISVMIAMFVIQIIDNSINQPVIFSNSVKSHPLEIFIVVLASGMFTGIFGMIAAIPIYTCIKVIGKEFLPNNKVVQILTKNL
ncbi:AI-2E family transporter [Myroides guanonis]|uniref:Predicted PurR-regulated permease PerM n=1 Tax=Myroides guanonis TaxID=1150112 RepID=A0A1I3KX36_9FLAO|nr:AI-2E family transporter [Myroides guanonis]SFI77081.1 Predicted PurR-regulated permease PerM [Myroides guanonis]